MAMVRRSREEWSVVLSELRASGLSTRAFAKSRNINVNTLQWWRGEIERAAASPAFAEVIVDEPVRERSVDPFVVVVAGAGHRIVVPRDFDGDDVRRLVRALC